jgi:integrase
MSGGIFMSITQPIRDAGQLQDFKQYYMVQKPNARNYMLCIFSLYTALRISDILHVKWEDVFDFDKKTALTHLMIKEHKTGKTSMIALNPAIRKTLQQYYAGLDSVPEPSDYVFPGRYGSTQPLCRCQAFRIIRKAAEEVGIQEHVSCHSLRKTFGYHAWKQGIPPALLMDIYNHSSYRITKRYLGIDQDDKDEVFLNITL